MQFDNFMTAREFAHLVNTPYPTVAQWLRDGRIPGAELTGIGHMKVWMIPKEALKDFKRPEMGRPKKLADVVATKNGVKRAAGVQTSLFETQVITAKPKTKARKTRVKKSTKKMSPKK